MAIFDDVSEFNDPDSPATMTRGRCATGKAIGVGKGNAVLDAGSYKPTGPGPDWPRRERERGGRATS